MISITVTLDDDQLVLAKALASEHGFQKVESYLETLLAKGLNDGDDATDTGAPDDLSPSSSVQLVTMIQEGLNSRAREMTQTDFEQMRTKLVERHTPSKAG